MSYSKLHLSDLRNTHVPRSFTLSFCTENLTGLFQDQWAQDQNLIDERWPANNFIKYAKK